MHLAEADVVVLLLHDLLHRLLLFERDKAETPSLVGLVLHRELHCLHLFRFITTAATVNDFLLLFKRPLFDTATG